MSLVVLEGVVQTDAVPPTDPREPNQQNLMSKTAQTPQRQHVRAHTAQGIYNYSW